MLYPVQYCIRQSVPHGSNYAFTVEEQLTVRWVAQPWIIFHNPICVSCRLKIDYTVSESGVFSDTFNVVDQVVAKDSILEWEVKKPLVQTSSRTSHSVTIYNNDGVDRTLYVLIVGWTDTKLVYNGTIYCIGAEDLP